VALIEDLGADSLDIAELSALLAEQGIELDKAAARQAASVADLIAIARPR
jgi:acyl carrier protein